MKTKKLLEKYFLFDTHTHTNDVSLCSRVPFNDLVAFYKTQFPWMHSLAVTNHSHSPGLYKSETMRKNIKRSSYPREVSGLQIINGIEVNILRDGYFDVYRKTLENIPWVLAALHPLKSEYEEVTRKLAGTYQEIEHRFLATINSGLVDMLVHPTHFIDKGIVEELNWKKIFSACAHNGVMVELNLLVVHDAWWLQELVDSRCIVSVGSDFHGTYHCRKFTVAGISTEEEKVRQFVLNNKGRYGYDALSREDTKLYDTIYTTKSLEDAFYGWLGTDFVKILKLGLSPDRIFNAYDLATLHNYLSLPRIKRKNFLNDLPA